MNATDWPAWAQSAESFFGVLKRDITQLIESDTRVEAVNRVDDYIINLHNALRRAHLRRALKKTLADKVRVQPETRAVEGLVRRGVVR